IDHRERRENRMMTIEADALARHAEQIGRIALGDQVGTEPIPDHQDHDTAASMMGAGSILRGQWRGAEKKKTRENSRKQSCEEHPIGHQSGREQSMSIAFGKGELLVMRERAKR